ncbi:Putative outer membrane lipoprotein carrier protein [Oceanicola granulosus HTCC2516]|uniref:Putative outer membrane lipoprotein carrier protein n=1 Tax=Oceanicola granulosus (strain ATCC BAA-861 / DSM 15982 / KCTC 12143 / HTCC2516) TaxID=314256 RepID=Q2CAH5_OCEGH|nr:outer membrane lipoprotein carrier protein LolA [Oceanicola granulosus]EAR49659.1 Putative outer membrane lipoprotein carrier protein [Oceanicola granulosus HTCC2516]
MKTIRHLLLLIPLIVAALATSGQAQQLSLAQISQYMNSFSTAQGEFTQINSDGTISTGTLLIKRPGRIRFQYNPPDRSLVLAGGGSVAVFDPQSDNNPERYPLSETPLKIILEQNVDFTRAGMVTGHGYDGTATTVTAQDPQHPEYGSIQLKFTGSPVELRQWIITDDAGQQTTVVLGDLAKNVAIGDINFNIQAATRDWQQ